MDNVEAAPPPPGKVAGIAITAIVVVLLAAWMAIWLMGLHKRDTELVGAFMFLWYWANNEQLRMDRLVPAMLGSLVGIGIAWFLLYGATAGGPMALAGLGVLILALYLDIIKVFPIAVNAATFLFVTLAAAPLVQLHVNWIDLTISTVAGGLFFVGAVWGLQKLAPAPAAN